jgi:hypothetical protein
MKGTQGQKYSATLFFGGLAADIDPEMLDAKTGAVLEAHYFHVSNTTKNILQKIRGSVSFIADSGLGAAATLIGAIWLNGYLVEFWYYSGSTHIFANGVLVANSANLPGDVTHYLDMDKNTETWEIFITDNKQCPIVLDLEDMLASTLTTEYFADYDQKLYEINKPVALSQPVFQCLENVGAGGGLMAGSYSYAMRYVSVGGDKTAWSPVCPYIPIPYNMRSGVSDAIKANSGVLIAGQAASLTPTKYGIRLKIRLTNIVGFDYIEVKRYTSNTGQPVSYTPAADYMILSLDINGSVIDIKNNPHSVIEFVDSSTQVWAALDESVSNTYSTIKRARTIRYFNRRIILGGVEYESKELTTQDIFITDPVTSKLTVPIIKKLGTDGFSNMQNQVYNRSHRSGERYGYAAKLYDDQGNMLYAVPLASNTSQAQVVHVQLTGSDGTVSIGYDGMAFPVTFDTSLTQTATNFVTAYATPFLNEGIILTSSGDTLIFTAAVAGVPFGDITIIYTTPIVVLNSIYTIQDGQTGTPIAISFSATNTGAAGIVRVYYNLRDSSHTPVQTYYQDFNMSVGTGIYNITGLIYTAVGADYDLQIGLTTSYTLTSNHFASLAYADPIYNLYILPAEGYGMYKDSLHTTPITNPCEYPFAYGTVGTPNLHFEFWAYAVPTGSETVGVRIFDFNGIEVYAGTCTTNDYAKTFEDKVLNRNIVAGDVFNIVIGDY